MGERVCSVDGCKGKYRAKGLCGSHYKLARNGEPLGGPIIHLCLDCGVDISERPPTSKRCLPCVAQLAKVVSRANKKTPNGRRYRAKYRQRPDVKSKAAEYEREYRQRDEIKERNLARMRSADYKQWRHEYNQRPDIKAKKLSRRNPPLTEREPRYCTYCTAQLDQWHYNTGFCKWCAICTKAAAKASKRASKPLQDRETMLRLRRERWHEYSRRPENVERIRIANREKGKRRRNDPEWLERKRNRKWDDTVTPASVSSLRRAQKGRCVACKSALGRKYHYDHITPVAKNGPSTLSNLQLLCQPCNASKSDKLYFIPPNKAQGRLSI